MELQLRLSLTKTSWIRFFLSSPLLSPTNPCHNHRADLSADPGHRFSKCRGRRLARPLKTLSNASPLSFILPASQICIPPPRCRSVRPRRASATGGIRDDGVEPAPKPISLSFRLLCYSCNCSTPPTPTLFLKVGVGLCTCGRVAVERGSAGLNTTQGFVRSVYYCALAELDPFPPACQLDRAGKSSLISLSLSLPHTLYPSPSLLLYLLASFPAATVFVIILSAKVPQ